MAASKSLQRLLGIRRVEEERSQTEMEIAVAELQRLALIQATAHKRGKHARALVASSAQTGELIDRIAGVQEMATASRMQRMLAVLLDIAKAKVEQTRKDLLARRLARRQVETLVEAKMVEARAETNRRAQFAHDDWHRSQRTNEMRKVKDASFDSDIPLTK